MSPFDLPSGRRPSIRTGALALAAAALALAAAALGTASVASLGAQEPRDAARPPVDCDSICLIFPDRAPPECACGILTGTGSGGGSTVLDPEARRVLNEMHEEYRRQVAGIREFTVVQVSSVAGLPVILHYEKDIVDGDPVFRQVSPAELARRESEATGMPTPTQTATGMATMFEMLQGMAEGQGGVSAGGTGAGAGEASPGGVAAAGTSSGSDEDEVRDEGGDALLSALGALIGAAAAGDASTGANAMTGGAEGPDTGTGSPSTEGTGSATAGANASTGATSASTGVASMSAGGANALTAADTEAGTRPPPSGGIPVPPDFGPAMEGLVGVLAAAAEAFSDIAHVADWEEEEAEFVGDALRLFQGSENTRLFAKDTLMVNGVPYSCDVLVNAHHVDMDGNVSTPAVEFDGIETPDGMTVRTMQLWVSDENSPHPKQPLKMEIDVGIPNETRYSPSPRTITRTASELGVANGWVYEKRTRFQGLGSALAGAVPWVETRICQMLVNQGEPFGEKSARLMQEAMSSCSQ